MEFRNLLDSHGLHFLLSWVASSARIAQILNLEVTVKSHRSPWYSEQGWLFARLQFMSIRSGAGFCNSRFLLKSTQRLKVSWDQGMA